MKVLMLGILLLLAQVTVGETPDRIRQQLQQATTATGADYFAARSNLVAFGSNSVPQLWEISANSKESWQVRLLAGIIAERIQRGAEITALTEKQWEDDPEYNKDWERRHSGALLPMTPLAVKRYKEARLWFYYMEIVWKETKEHSQAFRKWEPDWRRISWQACEGSPVFELLVRVLDERIRNDIGLKKVESASECEFLRDSKTNTALPFLLELVPLLPGNDSQKESEFYKILKNMAQPADVPSIEKHFKDKGQEIPRMLTRPLNALKRREAAKEGK